MFLNNFLFFLTNIKDMLRFVFLPYYLLIKKASKTDPYSVSPHRIYGSVLDAFTISPGGEISISYIFSDYSNKMKSSQILIHNFSS